MVYGGALVFSGILVNIFENLLGRGFMKILLIVKILVITLFFNCGPFYYKMYIVCILIFCENPMMFKTETDAAFHISVYFVLPCCLAKINDKNFQFLVWNKGGRTKLFVVPNYHLF